jgi:hypothetical protein
MVLKIWEGARGGFVVFGSEGGSFEGEKPKAGRRESIVEMEIDEWDFP